MTYRRLTPNDAMFLYGESPETMMHVASLLRFDTPDNAPPHMLREIIDEIRDTDTLPPPWNLKLRSTWLRHPFPAWVEDERMDIDYHVRRSALPSPGGERELGVLVSRLHGIQIDFSRPPWETHLIEGLQGGNFALYTKMHHSLIDGFTGNKMLAQSFSTDPGEHTPLFFNRPPIIKPSRPPRSPSDALEKTWRTIRTQLEAAGEVATPLRELIVALTSGDPELRPTVAPFSVLNGRIGRNRRFATQQYDMERVKQLARRAGGTLNDMVLAMCAGALRRFLLELGGLPTQPLVAMLPVAVRAKDDPGGGNSVGALLVSLATHLADARERLDAIIADTRRGKDRLTKLSRQAVLQLSALTMVPSGLQTITGTLGRVRPQFNVVISNVPGPSEQLYFRGAPLTAVYPVSVPIHGQALNITCQSYNGKLNFGFTGCRDTLPHMQRLAVYTGQALDEIDAALASAEV